MTDKPVWHESPCGKIWTRSDGATVRWTRTPTGKRPWVGSGWRQAGWKENWGSNTATAKSAMDGIDYHWPKPMGKT